MAVKMELMETGDNIGAAQARLWSELEELEREAEESLETIRAMKHAREEQAADQRIVSLDQAVHHVMCQCSL